MASATIITTSTTTTTLPATSAPAAPRAAATRPVKPKASARGVQDRPPTAQHFYSVQFGAFRNSQGSHALARRLAGKGIRTRVDQVQTGGKLWFKVRTGKFRSKERATQAAKSLSQKSESPPWWPWCGPRIEPGGEDIMLDLAGLKKNPDLIQRIDWELTPGEAFDEYQLKSPQNWRRGGGGEVYYLYLSSWQGRNQVVLVRRSLKESEELAVIQAPEDLVQACWPPATATSIPGANWPWMSPSGTGCGISSTLDSNY